MKKILFLFLSAFYVFAAQTIIVDSNAVCTPLGCYGGCESGDKTYSNITDAVNNSYYGDTIKICKGSYSDDIILNKSLSFVAAANVQKPTDVNWTASKPIVLKGGNDIYIDGIYIESTLGNCIKANISMTKIIIKNAILKAKKQIVFVKNLYTLLDIENSTLQAGREIIYINGSGSNVIIKDSNLTSSSDDGIDIMGALNGNVKMYDANISVDDNAFYVDDNVNGYLNIEKTIISSDSKSGFYFSGNINKDFNITDSKVTSKKESVKLLGSIYQTLNIINSELNSTSNDGIEVDKNADTINIVNSKITSYRNALYIYGGDVYKDINITSSLLFSQRSGVYVGKGDIGYFELRDSNVTVDDYGFYIRGNLNSNSAANLISDSEINASSKNALYIYGNVNGPIIVENSNIYAQSDNVFSFNDSVYADMNISNSSLIGSGGLKFKGDDANKLSIKDSNISASFLDAIYFGGDMQENLNVSNSVLKAPNGYTVDFENESKGIYIDKSLLSSDRTNIYCNGVVNGDVIISDSELSSDSRYNIYFNETSNKTYIKNSKLSADNSNIYFGDDAYDNVFVDNSSLDSESRGGIIFYKKASAKNLYIKDSNITSSDDYAVYLVTATNMEINSSHLKTDSKDVIYIGSDIKDTLIYSNCIDNNSSLQTNYGIYVDGNNYDINITNNCFYSFNNGNYAYDNGSKYNTHSWNGNFWLGVNDINGDGNLTCDDTDKITCAIWDSEFLKKCPHNCIGLVAEWRMDECRWIGKDYEVGDTQEENNGTAVNGANTVKTGVLCRSGLFEALNKEYVKVPASNSLTLKKTLTYMGWIKITNPNYVGNSYRLENIFTNQTWANALRYTEKGYYNNGLKENKILFQLSINGTEEYLYSNTSITDTKWHHIAVTYDGNTMKIYIDGNLDASKSVSGIVNTGNSENIIGGEYGNYYFNGNIDEFKVFNKALSKDVISYIEKNEDSSKSWDGGERICYICDIATVYNAVDYVNIGECNASYNWDDNITTKIAGSDYNLTILAKDENGNPVEANVTKVEFLYYSEGNQSECSGDLIGSKVICENCGNTNSKGCMTLDDDNLSVNRAVKCVEVYIEGHAAQNSSPDVNESNSTDDFAIRPYRFKIVTIPSKVKAGSEFNVTVEALDKKGNKVKDYNETIYIRGNSVDLEYNDTNSKCITAEINKTDGGDFIDGEANLTLKYPEVGDVNFTIQEVNGSEFAFIDNDDTNISQRLIMKDVNSTEFVVHHFDVNASLSNYDTNGGFTYLNKDLNLSAVLDVNISAKNEDNQTVENYNEECYAKDVEVNISYELSYYNKDINVTYFRFVLEDVKEENSSLMQLPILSNVEINYTEGNFTTDNNGSTTLKLYINFDRNVSFPSNPFKLIVNDINITNKDNNLSFEDISGESLFYYGFFDLNDILTSSNELTKTFAFVMYDENSSDSLKPPTKEHGFNWYENSYHNGIDGNISDSEIVVSSDGNASNVITDVEVNASEVKDGNITFGIKRTNSSLNFAVVHILSPNLKWLWYTRFGDEYNISNDSSCLNHFCFTITWQNLNNEKGEVGSGEFNGTEVNITESNTSKTGVKIFR